MTERKLHPADRANAPWRRECFYSTPNSMALKRKKARKAGVAHG